MIGTRLLEIRDENDLTQVEMSKILKTSQTNYSRWENMKEIMPLKKLNLLCNYFNVSMDYVVGITKDKSASGNHIINSITIGNNLKELRRKKGLTQKDIANLLNTSQSTISAYESGETMLLTIFAIEICNKYKISMDELVGRKEKELITNK